ncbi:M24 family metallopeptidase [Salipiger abyssi]|uniref:M24 family metallopeptidase n=1 Tax=Salipiger abyssi TaxID=1250539 RepID=UPI00405A271B
MTLPNIPDAEFETRRERARQMAKEAGLDALVIWSRSGNSVEAYGDLFYLTNFVSLFPCVPDRKTWSSRGHAALILPVDGAPVLLTDYLDDPEDRIKVTDVRFALDLAAGTGKALADMGLLDRRVGMVGMMSYLVSAHQRLEAAAGRPVAFESADHILEHLRLIKSPSEIAMLRHSASVGKKWMDATMAALVEGNTEGDAVGAGLAVLAANGGTQQDIAIASGPNAIHYMGSSGVPHWNVQRALEPGDLVHVDLWGPVFGYYTDFARSTVVGGKPDGGQKELLEGSRALIHHIIAGIEPGKTRFCDLYTRGTAWLDANGFANHKSTADETNNFSQQFPCFGHAIGLGIDGPWIVEDEQTVIQPNMTIAVEALVSKLGVGAANYEEDVLVTDKGAEILTSACDGVRWG